ncbi:MAG: hypothetical protein AAB589_01985 [Patescibacteria group bacterium]
MIATLTIPKKLAKAGDLILISREEYEGLLREKKSSEVKPSKLLDVGLRQAIKEYREGKAIGPFSNARDLIRSLRSK